MSKWVKECKNLVELLNHVHDEARKQAFLEAADMADKIFFETRDLERSVASFCDMVEDALREKAEEAKK